MDGIVVHHSHVLLQCVMHESQTVAASWIIHVETITLVLEPLNLVTSHAIHTSIAVAVSTTGTKEPKSEVDNAWVHSVLDSDLICKLMIHFLSIVLVVVWQGCRVLLIALKLKDFNLTDVAFVVVIAWHDAPWDLQSDKLSGDI